MTAAAAAVLLGLSACTSDETDTASETTTAVETTATSGSSTTEQAEESAQHSEADVMFAPTPRPSPMMFDPRRRHLAGRGDQGGPGARDRAADRLA